MRSAATASPLIFALIALACSFAPAEPAPAAIARIEGSIPGPSSPAEITPRLLAILPPRRAPQRSQPSSSDAKKGSASTSTSPGPTSSNITRA